MLFATLLFVTFEYGAVMFFKVQCTPDIVARFIVAIRIQLPLFLVHVQNTFIVLYIQVGFSGQKGVAQGGHYIRSALYIYLYR